MPTTPDLQAPRLHADEGVGELVHRAVADARALAGAEVELYKAKFGDKLTAWKSAAVFFVAAVVLVLAAVIALLVGLIFTLAPLVGPGGATAIVIVATLLIAAVLAFVGKGKLK
ncbi:phage holin family protein [Sphingomonas bacterium]|uniref:phage holin family protein n=1 Tax=Sphingomonas bacterium TaxID=1895847 RepID=UPI00157700BF|nr:phage holin family protein [Sphingomonas bacterium]